MERVECVSECVCYGNKRNVENFKQRELKGEIQDDKTHHLKENHTETLPENKSIEKELAADFGFGKGVNEMEFIPGIYGKFGLNFEYSPYDEKLKSMEVGVAFDLFYKEVPLMYDTYNNQYWITFYLMLEIGKKIE